MTRRATGRRLSLMVACLLVGPIAGCSPSEEGFRVAWRALSEPPHELLGPSALGELESVVRWELADAKVWRAASRYPAPEATSEGLRWKVASDELVLHGRIALAADRVDVLEVVGEIPQGASGLLFWRGPGEEFSQERRVLGRTAQGRALRFDVGEEISWVGQIRGLRLHLRELGEGAVVELDEVRGSRYLAPPRILAGQPRLVDRDGDVRACLVQPVGGELRRTVTAPAGSALTFAYGASLLLRSPVSFRLTASAGGAARVLLDEVVERTSPPWTEARLDLGGLAGSEIELTFQVESDDEAGLAFWAHPELLVPGRVERPPILLISVDTLRADRLSSAGYERETSPQLDAWAARSGVVFEQAVASSPWTLPSHVSMLTGLDAHRHGVNHGLPVPSDLETLAERLRAAGYFTVAITGGVYLHPRYGLAQGFDRFHYWTSPLGERELESGVDLAARILEEAGDRPIFLFFHTYEVHAPYRPRQPWFGLFSDLSSDYLVKDQHQPGLHETRRVPQGRFVVVSRESSGPGRESPLPADLAGLPGDTYDAGVAYADHHLGRLLKTLDRVGLADDSLVVLTSDHGEMLGEHGLAGHLYLYEENLRVPLIVDLPGAGGGGGRVGVQVAHPDLVPTILDAAGLEVGEDLDGRSLVSLARGGDPSFPERVAWSYAANGNHGLSLRLGGRLKYVARNAPWPLYLGFEELYRLDRDPRERHNLAAGAVEIPALRRRLEVEWNRAAAGIRVRLENETGKEIAGHLAGSAVTFDSVKSLDLPCPCLTWDAAVGARFVVPPGESYTLLVGEPRGEELVVALESSGSRLVETIALRSLARSDRRFGLGRDGGWRVGEDPDSVANVTVWWPKARREIAGEPTEIEPDLERQLRALGYVE